MALLLGTLAVSCNREGKETSITLQRATGDTTTTAAFDGGSLISTFPVKYNVTPGEYEVIATFSSPIIGTVIKTVTVEYGENKVVTLNAANGSIE
jgi:hypothetical protein